MSFPHTRGLKFAVLSLFLLGFFALGTWRVAQRGSFEQTFDQNADEASHFVTSLMVTDYLATGLKTDPLTFAEKYYASYPKVAFGVWPPLFHLSQGVWMFVFGPSRMVALCFSVFAIALASVVFFVFSSRVLGRTTAWLGAGMLVALPGVMAVCGSVMADPLCVPLCLGAVWFFARYLRSGQLHDSIGFGLLAAAALLTKYNPGALALVPFVTMVLTRRWDIMRNWRTWMAPLVVVAVAGPWYAAHWSLVHYAADMGVVAVPSLGEAGLGNLQLLGGFLGWPGALLAAYGVWVCQREGGAVWEWGSTMLALLAGVWVFHSVVYPIVDSRYLLPAVPALVFFALAGWRQLPGTGPAVRMAVAAAVILALLPGWLDGERGHSAWKATAQKLKGVPVMLVSADALGEGAMVAEVALNDRRPGQVVLRSSKMLARATWMNAGYRRLFGTPEELDRALDAWRVSTLVVDHAIVDPAPHHRQVQDYLAGPHGANWNTRGASGAVRIYERRSAFRQPPAPIRIDLTETMGRFVTPSASSGPLATNGGAVPIPSRAAVLNSR